MHAQGELRVLGEVTNQYEGIQPDDPRMEPYWALAEELDMPVGIHIGTGPPGAIYLGAAGYRAQMHSALTIEEVLVKHPKLRVYIMHAGYPMIDDLLAVLYAHPQVYVDVGVIVYTQPRPAFYRYLQAIVDAGFANRVMFGSDQMVWPGTIERAIAVIDEAPLLTRQQKRDIFYNNAARFLRLSKEDIARHHSIRDIKIRTEVLRNVDRSGIGSILLGRAREFAFPTQALDERGPHNRAIANLGAEGVPSTHAGSSSLPGKPDMEGPIAEESPSRRPAKTPLNSISLV